MTCCCIIDMPSVRKQRKGCRTLQRSEQNGKVGIRTFRNGNEFCSTYTANRNLCQNFNNQQGYIVVRHTAHAHTFGIRQNIPWLVNRCVPSRSDVTFQIPSEPVWDFIESLVIKKFRFLLYRSDSVWPAYMWFHSFSMTMYEAGVAVNALDFNSIAINR